MKLLFHFHGFKFGLLLTLMAIIFPGLIFSGQAVSAQGPGTAGQAAVGQVIAIAPDKSSFTIQTDTQNQETISVDQNTRYTRISISDTAVSSIIDVAETFLGESALNAASITGLIGLAGISIQSASFNNIAVGDTVTVSFSSAGNTASDVNILKFTNVQHVRGTITGVASGSITIAPPASNAVTVNWNNNTRFLLNGIISIKAGQIANAIYSESTGQALVIIVKSAAASPAGSPAAPSPGKTPG
jgi:hypothetical protein